MAARIRAGDAAALATSTMPALHAAAAAAEIGAPIAKAWGYCSDFREAGAATSSASTVTGEATAKAGSVSTGKATGKVGSGEVTLSIDAAGPTGVLLVIR